MSPIESVEMPPSACPSCGTVIEVVTGTRGARPGDVSLCVYCHVYLVLLEDFRVRLLTDGEWFALSPGERAQLARIRDDVRRRMPRGPRTN